MFKTIGLLAALLGLAACQPPMSRYTKSGEPCHPIGHSFAPIWVAPNGHTVCVP
jgi:hypothetical protein